MVTTAPTNLLAFPREALFTLLREEPSLAGKFLWGMAMEMKKLIRRLPGNLYERRS